MRNTIAVCLAAAAAAVGQAVPAAAAGQVSVDFTRGPAWMLGYVVNAPEQLMGFGAVLPGPGRWGLHVNGKLSLGSPERDDMFEPNMTPSDAEDLGDTPHSRRSAWVSANGALVRGLTRDLALYIGGGVTSQTIYIQYVDETLERGFFGRYWVTDDHQPPLSPNFVVGGFFRMGNRLVFQFGGETVPPGFTVGGMVLVR